MKNSALYARKIKRLLSRKSGGIAARAEPVDALRLLVKGIMEEDATAKQVTAALAALEQEYVDFNELRVSPLKDVYECLGKGFPGARAKADAVTRALNVVFGQANALSLDYLAKKPKREVRKVLREKLGLSPYAESVVTLYGFDGHAIPADNLLLEALKLDGYVHPGSDVPDLQGFLERIIPNKDAIPAHEALREYAWRRAGRVAKELARRAKLAAEAEAKAKAEAEAQAKAEAEAKAKAEAEAKAKAKARRKKAAGRKPVKAKKARPKATRPRAAGKSRPKTNARLRAKSSGKAKTKKKSSASRKK
jgi:endonuclease III